MKPNSQFFFQKKQFILLQQSKVEEIKKIRDEKYVIEEQFAQLKTLVLNLLDSGDSNTYEAMKAKLEVRMKMRPEREELQMKKIIKSTKD